MTNNNDFKNTTFLGGTCANSTWREELINQLSPSVDYFNPVVEDWTPECQAVEDKAREECRFLLFVITKEMTGFFSIAEVVDCSNKRPSETLFCFIPDGFQDFQLKSLKAVGKMVSQNGAKCFSSLDDIAEFLNNQY